ncbi:MAG TPA: hypothetical protein VJ865_06015 [Gemmatimonadaceae bacterium]|nr:hypothetical protein [Gemmatimonadaceae bacterium]
MSTRFIVLAATLVSLAACNGFKRGSGAVNPNEPTTLQVDNQGFLDMAVYAVRSVERIRLGTATGNSKTNLRIPSALVNGLTPMRFIADPIGATRASISEEITVSPGDTVVLTIPPI